MASKVSLRLIVLKTNQVPTVCDFYRELGLELTEEQHGKGPIHFSAPLGDAILEIYPLPDGKTVDSTTRLGFGVNDPDAIAFSIETKGGRIVKPAQQTPWVYVAIVADPDGRVVELYLA